MTKKYDSSWGLRKSNRGNLPRSRAAFDRKYMQWVKRDWVTWLKKNLVFPFNAKRMEDEDDAYFTDVARHEPFRLGHIMEIIAIEGEEWPHGIMVSAREGKKRGRVPLCDLEVRPKTDKNFWPVREYVVWVANR